jgi:hypothetical protein
LPVKKEKGDRMAQGKKLTKPEPRTARSASKAPADEKTTRRPGRPPKAANKPEAAKVERKSPRVPAKPTADTSTEKPELSTREVNRRIKILHRFRELLQTQRDRFQQYLELLEKQQDLINGDWEASKGGELEAQVNLEERIVADIFAIQKVISPLEDMYKAAYPAQKKAGRRGRPKKDEANAGIPDLKTALETLSGEAALLSGRNKELLAQRMDRLKGEIKTLSKNPYKKGRSVYGETPSPSLIDIQG